MNREETDPERGCNVTVALLGEVSDGLAFLYA